MVKVFVEGGGNSKSLRARCREGFRKFIEKAGLEGRMMRIVPCGGRRAAFDKFRTACESDEAALLLVDSEDPVASTSPWDHLSRRPDDKFQKPPNADDSHCHLMVVCMESWFLADKAALAAFFGQGFNSNALPKNEKIESVSKSDVYDGLKRASSNCKTKAPYGKGEHSFRILMSIAPRKVRAAGPWADRFLETLADFMKRDGETR